MRTLQYSSEVHPLKTTSQINVPMLEKIVHNQKLHYYRLRPSHTHNKLNKETQSGD